VSEYLNDDEQLQALRRWWHDNGTALIVGLLLAIGGVVGWRWYTDHMTAGEEAASAAYQRYLELRSAATATAADKEAALAVIDAQFPASAYHVFTLFYRAKDAVDAGDYAQAAQWLGAALADARDESLRDLARLRLARVRVQLGETDTALALLREVKGTGFRGYVAELQGDILLGQGNKREALEAYRRAAAAAAEEAPDPVLKMKIIDLEAADASQP
jgi:predicted negative regulator of RcsB-dependent stress response